MEPDPDYVAPDVFERLLATKPTDVQRTRVRMVEETVPVGLRITPSEVTFERVYATG